MSAETGGSPVLTQKRQMQNKNHGTEREVIEVHHHGAIFQVLRELANEDVERQDQKAHGGHEKSSHLRVPLE